MALLIGNNRLNLKNQEFDQPTLRSLWLEGIDWLNKTSVSNSTLESELLLRAAFGLDKSRFYAQLSDVFTGNGLTLFNKLIQRRMSGEPLPYILGRKEFYGLEFLVSKTVLIPRPETELLVDLALHKIEKKYGSFIADIGTGSGCLAVSIATHSDIKKIVAVDKSFDALKIASQNLAVHGLSEVIDLVNADLLTSFERNVKFDLIVSNPPYLPDAIYQTLDPEIKSEPKVAIHGGHDGLETIRRLVDQASLNLSRHGVFLFEVFSDFSNEASSIAAQSFPNANVVIHNDLLGLPRVVEVSSISSIKY